MKIVIADSRNGRIHNAILQIQHNSVTAFVFVSERVAKFNCKQPENVHYEHR